MANPFDARDAASVLEYLEGQAHAQPSPDYERALAALEVLAECGDPDITDALARTYFAPGRCHDAAAAYRWFYISLSQLGFLTDYRNEYEAEGKTYLGPAGDFRNEDEVSVCIEELGLAALPSLDRQARAWLEARV